jgi:hypothetical protein
MCFVPALTHALKMLGRLGFSMVEYRIFGRQCVPFRLIEEAFGTLQTGHAASLRDVFGRRTIRRKVAACK